MRIDNATEKAGNTRTDRQAAELYNNLNYELALGNHPPEHREEARRAQAHLEERFPGVKEASYDVDKPPQLSRGASERLGSDSAPRRRTQPRGGREPVRRGRARRAGARQTAGRALDLADTASGGWGAAIGDIFVWGAAMSIFYLLITKAAATGKLAEGASNIVRAVISPVVDPLNPKGIA